MLTARDVLERYRDEELPDFVDRPLADVNEIGRFGNAPLHVAAVRGDPEEVAALVAGGADVNAVGELGNKPIHAAIAQQKVDVVRMLLDAGATLDGINELDQSPIDIAVQSGNQAIIDLVLRHSGGSTDH